MDQLKSLNDRIISRVNVNLSEFDFDTESFVTEALDYEKMMRFYAFYGITSRHPIYFHFRNCNIAGSYFLGKCHASRSAIYKSDVRGDELKRRGDNIRCAKNIPLVEDEVIVIRDSLLYKTLVHSNSHNLESPEEFGIRNTISAHYANIHGSTLEGCFIFPFATVDLMNLHSCIVGEFTYVQAGELFHRKINPGTIWIRNPNFEFKYRFRKEILDNYVGVNSSYQPRGLMYDFVQERDRDYEKLFDVMNLEPIKAPDSSAVNRYAVVKGKIQIGENVLVAQRAFLDNAVMGDGSNAQENSYIINST
ncbi:MAG: transferase, partial [Desulfobacteraceae bacterium]|nr:transferase [Desulfobacteraceae bacterium]